jgi:hypothetical protein
MTVFKSGNPLPRPAKPVDDRGLLIASLSAHP